MAGGKSLFRTIVSRFIEIRFVVGTGVLPLCGFSLPRLSRRLLFSVRSFGAATPPLCSSLPRNLVDHPAASEEFVVG